MFLYNPDLSPVENCDNAFIMISMMALLLLIAGIITGVFFEADTEKQKESNAIFCIGSIFLTMALLVVFIIRAVLS